MHNPLVLQQLQRLLEKPELFAAALTPVQPLSHQCHHSLAPPCWDRMRRGGLVGSNACSLTHTPRDAQHQAVHEGITYQTRERFQSCGFPA